MSRSQALRVAAVDLWLKLSTIFIFALAFAEALRLSRGQALGWFHYLSGYEVAFEVFVRFVFCGLLGFILAAIVSVAVWPFLWRFSEKQSAIISGVTKIAVVVVLFLDSRFALLAIIHAMRRGERFIPYLLVAQSLIFVLALLFLRTRRQLTSSLDVLLVPKVTRRTAIATAAGAAALVVAEYALSRTGPVARAVATSLKPRSNFLLITFDALNAEDLSIYGYGLPTTPNIDKFARNATVFNRFFSASTFTTPSVATMLTGLYPSESHVYQLQGRLRSGHLNETLPALMRQGGYTVASFATNPFAYYFARDIGEGFNVLPEPKFQRGGLQRIWDITTPLHQHTHIGSRIDEYFDMASMWNLVTITPSNEPMRFRPLSALEHGQKLLANLPDGFFLWIHVITPHSPYLPDPIDRGRFLPDSQLTTFEEESGRRWQPHYPLDVQNEVTQRRLRYDEFIATADRAFGSFMSQLEASGRLHNTTVAVSADHGESFEGGVYQHSSPYLTRPVIHIPLIVRTPNQSAGRFVNLTADQTSLAPTILDLAGISKPDWMTGPSLVKWLSSDDDGAGQGSAYCQYLERNRFSAPITHGTFGIINKDFQYIVYLDTQKGQLRPYHEAQYWDLDRTSEYPSQTAELRTALAEKFPGLIRKDS